MIEYLIESSILLFVLLLFYKLLLEKERAFVFNRFFLLFSLVISFLAPLTYYEVMIDQSESFSQLAYTPMAEQVTLETLNTNPNSNSATDWSIILVFIYCFGVLVTASRFIINLNKMFAKCRTSNIEKEGSYRIIRIDKDQLAHSFFNYLFIPANTDSAVIEHEKKHADALHSLDIVLIELLSIVFWFNPLIYWHKFLIKLNHEFAADDHARNTQPKNYHRLILNSYSKNHTNSLASGFYYSFIKKRLMMLSKFRSGPLLWAKKVLVLPLFAGLAFMACEKVEAQVEKEVHRENVSLEAKTMATFFNGRKISEPIFYHEEISGKISAKEMHRLINLEGIPAFDHLAIELEGKRYEGRDLMIVSYSEAREDLFMYNLPKNSAILRLSDEAKILGKKYRQYNLGKEKNFSITYDADQRFIPNPPPPPPPPPPVKAVSPSADKTAAPSFPEKVGANKANQNSYPAPPSPPVAPSAVAPPPPPPPPPMYSVSDAKRELKMAKERLEKHQNGTATMSAEDLKYNKKLISYLEKMVNKSDN